MNELIEDFLREECTPEVRALLRGILAKKKNDLSSNKEELVLNRFNLVLDFSKQELTLEDDLDIDEEGTTTISFEDFLSLIDTPLKR